MTPEERIAKRTVTARQMGEVIKQGAMEIKVTCECSRKVPIHLSIRCLYCGEYYCQKCAEVHFGETRVARNERKNTRLCSGFGVFPDGSKCLGCDDCKEM